MPIEQTDGRIVLKHAKGATAEILLYGATVISWKTGTQADEERRERLFVSSKAALDGTKPVRGGIPIVFPCFGVPRHAEHARLGQHGFARNQVWTYGGVVADDGCRVCVRLTLGLTGSIEAVYGRAFELGYVVTLEEHGLTTELQVTNTGGTDEALEFQALLHSYIRAPAGEVEVHGLQDTTYYDKTEGSEEGRERRAGVDVRRPTDSVYEEAGGRYEVRWGGGGVCIAAAGFKDVVVWNPGAARGREIGDLEAGGW